LFSEFANTNGRSAQAAESRVICLGGFKTAAYLLIPCFQSDEPVRLAFPQMPRRLELS
jgi:hypothetical protein